RYARHDFPSRGRYRGSATAPRITAGSLLVALPVLACRPLPGLLARAPAPDPGPRGCAPCVITRTRTACRPSRPRLATPQTPLSRQDPDPWCDGDHLDHGDVAGGTGGSFDTAAPL